MANSPQAIKRARQNKKSAARNRVHHSRMRTAIKKLLKNIHGKEENSANEFKQVAALIDHTVGKGIIHRNKADRLKSRLNKKLKLQATSQK